MVPQIRGVNVWAGKRTLAGAEGCEGDLQYLRRYHVQLKCLVQTRFFAFQPSATEVQTQLTTGNCCNDLHQRQKFNIASPHLKLEPFVDPLPLTPLPCQAMAMIHPPTPRCLFSAHTGVLDVYNSTPRTKHEPRLPPIPPVACCYLDQGVALHKSLAIPEHHQTSTGSTKQHPNAGDLPSPTTSSNVRLVPDPLGLACVLRLLPQGEL